MDKNDEGWDAYCEVYGYTLENKILSFFLCFSRSIAACDISRLEKISKPKVYQVVEELIQKGYVVKGRAVGKTQLYDLNTEHPHVKIFLRNFRECLKMVADEYIEKQNGNKSHSTLHGGGAVSARHA